MQSGLQADPDNAELQNLKAELEEVISLTETAIAELKPSPAAAAAAAPAPRDQRASAAPPTNKEKWSKENHPAYQAGYRKPEAADEPESAPVPSAFAVNDTVMAKWKSGDKAFYPAKISAITGSSSKPIYIVTFRIDGSTDTLQAHEIRHMSNDSKKRKADGAIGSSGTSSVPNAAANTAAPATSPTGVISAAANIDLALASQVKKEPSKVSDGPERPAKAPRKVKANKELEAGKNKWQAFNMKGGKMTKSGKKESMFRTGEGVNARGLFHSCVSCRILWLTVNA